MARTVLAFHAHPDDEALLTGGTLARAAAEGHRVVLVVATDGALGLTSHEYAADLAAVRRAELAASASALGVHRVVELGYADSGLGPAPRPDLDPDRIPFSRVPAAEPAGRLAAVLREEAVDVLLSYDVNGGYGHPDHRKVHVVGAAAAAAAGTPRVLECAVDFRLARLMAPRGVRLVRPPKVTHVIDVSRYAAQKRAAMLAHQSQLVSNGIVPRNMTLLTRLPIAAFRSAAGTERYLEASRRRGIPVARDIFADL